MVYLEEWTVCFFLDVPCDTEEDILEDKRRRLSCTLASIRHLVEGAAKEAGVRVFLEQEPPPAEKE